MNAGVNDRDVATSPALAGDDWDALGVDWRGQVATRIDVDGLRRETGRRGRRLRWALAAEMLVTAIAIGLLAWAAFLPGEDAFSPVALGVLAALLVGCQAWSLWIRRRQVRDSGLDARALLRLERDRIATSLLYWRVNIWALTLLWVGLCAMLLSGLATPTGDGSVAGISLPDMVASVLANLPVVLGFAVFGCWWSGRNRARLERVRALQDALDAD